MSKKLRWMKLFKLVCWIVLKTWYSELVFKCCIFLYVTFEIILVNVPIYINVIHINIFKLSHHECCGLNLKFVTKGMIREMGQKNVQGFKHIFASVGKCKKMSFNTLKWIFILRVEISWVFKFFETRFEKTNLVKN